MKTVALTVLLLAIPTLKGAPRAALPEPSFSFGKVLVGESLQHDFVLKNDGTEPLRILAVSLTNGLQLNKAPAVIAPGSQTLLSVRLKASEATGPFEGKIRLELNDPESPACVLRVSAEVTP